MFNKKIKKKHTKKDQQTNQSKLEKQNEKIIVFSSKKLTYSAEMYEQKGSGLISNPKLCFVTVKARVGTSF